MDPQTAQAILEVLLSWLLYGPPDSNHETGESIHLTQYVPDPSGQTTMSQTSVEDMSLLQIMMEVLERLREDMEEGGDQTRQVLEMLPPPIKYKTHDIELGSIECVICLEDFIEGVSCRNFPVCKHILSFGMHR
ncbi:43kDa postsynaptic protein [Quillaja saponaria]|uniref:43kDa postsynaptic protein n=1 Tax=Quillaja saponaria TaxID=32244 RepID=A0AAD7QHW4_QUISA|nr:43kDa postsynaptic protein [Quillaja saponaria]